MNSFHVELLIEQLRRELAAFQGEIVVDRRGKRWNVEVKVWAALLDFEVSHFMEKDEALAGKSKVVVTSSLVECTRVSCLHSGRRVASLSQMLAMDSGSAASCGGRLSRRRSSISGHSR